jgi:23S rRNA pseudouridine1911/1915/1917 synthase
MVIKLDNKIEQPYEMIDEEYVFDITHGFKPERLDVFLTTSIKNASRNKIRYAIDNELALVNGKKAKPSQKIKPGDKITCLVRKHPPIELIPEDIPLDVVYEDDYVMVVNKPAGMCAHPGIGNVSGTLINAVLYHLGLRESIKVEGDEEDEEISNEKLFASDEIRPGLVHRIDKNTTGLLLVAKDPVSHAKLQKQFRAHTTERYYYALAWGNIKEDSGTIEGNIGRSTRNRKIFTVQKRGGKTAKTDFEVIERYGYLTLLKIKLWTGRTHQIRVHFSNRNTPILGDIEYGGDKMVHGGSHPEFGRIAKRCLAKAKRQMLHARVLGFEHPHTGELLSFTSELPDDMAEIIDILKNDYLAKIIEAQNMYINSGQTR